MDRTTAIVLAGGRGSRMKAEVPKQYLMLDGKPLLYYSLKAFEESSVDCIVLVTGEGEEEYCRKTIVERYGFKKVGVITAGGKERYHSVYNGLTALKNLEQKQFQTAHSRYSSDQSAICRGIIMKEKTSAEPTDYVLIHDGARPFLSGGLIERMLGAVKKYGSCAAGVPSKDTVKIAAEDGTVLETPDRNRVWQVQTPQAFRYDLLKEAYDRLFLDENFSVTDDASVVERAGTCAVHMVMGSYSNIKITTPEDLIVAQSILRQTL